MVCPASVVTNWVREIALRTELPVRKVHGPQRDDALGRWRAEGGVAVTTYATLGRVWEALDGFELDALGVANHLSIRWGETDSPAEGA